MISDAVVGDDKDPEQMKVKRQRSWEATPYVNIKELSLSRIRKSGKATDKQIENSRNITNNRRNDMKWLNDLEMIQDTIWKGQFWTTGKLKQN